MDLAEKLEILADSAKYDVACTSSGVGRPGRHGSLGSCAPAGHLPCLYAGWALRVAFEGAVLECLQL